MGIERRFLGIHVSPAAVQSEGLHRVLDRIQAAGASAIGTGTTVFQPGGPGQGRREPPLDIDGTSRILERPLWGQRETWLKGYRSYPSDESLYAGTRYLPEAAGPVAGCGCRAINNGLKWTWRPIPSGKASPSHLCKW